MNRLVVTVFYIPDILCHLQQSWWSVHLQQAGVFKVSTFPIILKDTTLIHFT